MADEAGLARPKRSESAITRWLTTAWCLLAGALLAVAPRAPSIWTADFCSQWPALREILWTDAARWGISGFGLLLLAAGAWDVSRFVVEELT